MLVRHNLLFIHNSLAFRESLVAVVILMVIELFYGKLLVLFYSLQVDHAITYLTQSK